MAHKLGTNWLNGLMEPAALVSMRQHEVADSYWESGRLNPVKYARVTASILLVTGFYDIFAGSISRMYRGLKEHAAPAARENQFLVIGPWTHGGPGAVKQGDVTYPPEAVYGSSVNDVVALFTWCLQGAARPTFAPVRYWISEFTSGTTAKGEWRNADKWPPLASTETPLYLQGDGSLATSKPSGAAAMVVLPADPAMPVPSLGGGNLTTAAGPMDQRKVDALPSVTTFTTKPVDGNVEIVGDPRAMIWASASTTDADVVVRVEVVTADGAALMVSDGIRRGRFREGYTAKKPLTPNAPAAFDVQLGPIALRLAKGQSLRVAISPSSAPRYEANPQNDQPIGSNPMPTKGTVTLYRDAEHPSVVALPLTVGSLGPVEPGFQLADGGTGDDAGTNPSGTPGTGDTTSGCSCDAAGVSRGRVSLGVFAALVGLFAARIRSRRKSG